MARVPLAFSLLVLLAPGASLAEPAAPSGAFQTPLGVVELSSRGPEVVGTLLTPAAGCPFAAGEEILRATLLDDSLAGKLRVWLTGERCGARAAWASAVLLVQGRTLSGAVHVAERGCRAPVGPRGGVVFTRAEPAARAQRPGAGAGAPTAEARRAQARALLRDGAGWLQEGNFEGARRRFLEAIERDPELPEAYNGVGVTYRMRNDHAAALEWYKKALAVNPDFGDAYYNMACLYALEGRKALALRYLQVAALNGYASAEGMDADPDLAALRDEPAYRALLKARL